MKRFSCSGRGGYCLQGSIAALLLISITPANAQTNNHEFNDSYFHMTNNVQRVPHSRFYEHDGSKAGHC
jgi:hypothetical protein